MHLIITRICFFILLVVTDSLVAQSVSLASKAEENLINFYHSSIAESDPIYNGCEYTRLPFYINTGIPYFLSDTMVMASVAYQGMLYKDVPAMYDMISDELVTRDFSGRNMIRLVKQKVDSFYLNGGLFISIRDDDQTIQPGYYQLLQRGKIELLKKNIKHIKEKVKYGQALEKNIENEITYYVKYEGKYFHVEDGQSLISIIPESKEKINIFLRENKNLRRKNDPGLVLSSLISYYNLLKE